MELLGQDISDYVHPCDHEELRKLVPSTEAGSGEQQVEVRSLDHSCIFYKTFLINVF